MIPGSANPLLLKSAAAAAGGYQVSRSLRFNSSDSGFCSRTPAVAGDRKTFTFACWVKRVKDDASPVNIFAAGANNFRIAFGVGATAYLQVYDYNGSSYNFNKGSAASYRDFSAWYHIVVAIDTTNATADDRVKMYVNGSRITDLYTGTNINPSQNLDTYVNSTSNAHYIGYLGSSGLYLDAYLADIHFIDGQALTPSSFTEVSATTGQLIPKAYSGSFGTNGFWLKFSDNSAATAATLGKDYSPNGNNWTPNNLSVTAGAGNDSLVDTPTSYGTPDTGVGGEVRGNYCTWNPLVRSVNNDVTLSNGNLLYSKSAATGWSASVGTLAASSGKWYFELTVPSGTVFCGVASTAMDFTLNALQDNSSERSKGFLAFCDDGKYLLDGAARTTYSSSLSAGQVLGVAVDFDGGTAVFYKNGTSQGSINISSSALIGKQIVPVIIAYYSGQDWNVNFGQRAWAHTPPANHKAWCDTNLPAPLVAKPNTVFNIITYTGTGATQTLPNASSTPSTPLGFSPDLVWIKCRSVARNHALQDTVRGALQWLGSNLTNAESTDAGSITSFNSDGFTLGNATGYNQSGETHVAWTWDAGTSTVSNTQGSITSQVRANASAGFSVVTYTGNGTDGATVGHGLGVSPGMIIVKNRDAAYDWMVAHSGLTSGYNLDLNSTIAQANTFGRGRIGTYGSSTFTLTVGSGGTSLFDNVNQSTIKYVAYAFAPVVGYTSAGSYTGNGSADGPFVYTSMRPRWILLKRTDSTGNWTILDTAREGYNVDNDPLFPNLADAEGTADLADILSNGFKLRSTDASVNASGGTYIYYAISETAFQYSRAR